MFLFLDCNGTPDIAVVTTDSIKHKFVTKEKKIFVNPTTRWISDFKLYTQYHHQQRHLFEIRQISDGMIIHDLDLELIGVLFFFYQSKNYSILVTVWEKVNYKL